MADKNGQEPLLTSSQAWDVVKFAQALNNGLYGVSGLFTPSMLNQNLVGLNNDPKTPDYDSVVQSLLNGLSDVDKIRAYQEWMEFGDMIFERTLEYYANMLSFDLTITCTTVDKEGYNSSKYKNDLNIVYGFLDGFDYQSEFKRVVRQAIRSETAYMWLRHNNNPKNTQYTLQLMPQRRCKLTGYFQRNIPLYDFDMNYFLQPGVSIDEYDDFFKQQFQQMYSEANIRNYIPTNPFDDRKGTFAYTTQTTPIVVNKEGLISGAWAFKLDNSNFNQMPLLAAMMRDAILNIPIQALQYDKDAAAAHAYLVGEIGMLQATEPNATKFDPIRLGNLLNIIKQAVGKHVGVGAMPVENLKWFQFSDNNTTMYENQLKTSAGVGASASRMIYATDKMSQEEVRNAIITDSNIVAKMYSQFEYFLEFYINKLTKKHKFKFTFNGTNYPFEREKRQEKIMKLAENGIILGESAFASAFGYKPTDFHRLLEESASNDSWLNNLRQLLSVHTQSGKGGTGTVGRPQQDDVTTQSREYDTSGE